MLRMLCSTFIIKMKRLGDLQLILHPKVMFTSSTKHVAETKQIHCQYEHYDNMHNRESKEHHL